MCIWYQWLKILYVRIFTWLAHPHSSVIMIKKDAGSTWVSRTPRFLFMIPVCQLLWTIWYLRACKLRVGVTSKSNVYCITRQVTITMFYSSIVIEEMFSRGNHSVFAIKSFILKNHKYKNSCACFTFLYRYGHTRF